MRNRILLLVAALVLGGLAAVASARYLESAKTRIQAEGEPVEVLVATADIPRGMSVEELTKRKLIVKQAMPRQFVSANAVSSPRVIEGQVLSSALARGEQVTAGRFQYASAAGLSYGVPKGQAAVSIPYEEARGVGGLVKAGDTVMVVASFVEPSDPKASITRVLLPKAKVLAVGQRVGPDTNDRQETPAQPQQASALAAGSRTGTSEVARTVTLALAPSDVEKLVFAQENGRIWLSLLAAESDGLAATSGRTRQTEFER